MYYVHFVLTQKKEIHLVAHDVGREKPLSVFHAKYLTDTHVAHAHLAESLEILDCFLSGFSR